MYFFLVAFGVMLHVLFWGAGGAMLITPRPWKRFWPLLAAPVGLALQSIVVWLGAYANFRGTDRYALGSEAVPLLLAIAGLWWHGWRSAANAVRRLAGVWLATALSLAALIGLMVVGAKGIGLTTMSLGSCDAADYAAGARVLKEFAHADRTGFLGLTEVVRVMSTDNFFDFWLRLNHFTPSALIALNGSIFDCQPYELTGVVTAVLLASSLPLVYWLARTALRYRHGVSLWIALLYGFSPIAWYAVFQVAMGQLLAAQGIIVLTWAGVALWRGAIDLRRGAMMSGLLFIGYTLVLGSYNFILVVALVPAVAYVGGLTLWRGEWRRFARWLAFMVAPLVASGLLFFQRVAGLTERFALFQTYDFGWRIPALSPEGWLGMVANEQLSAFPTPWRVALAGLVLVAFFAALFPAVKRAPRDTYLALSLTVPVLVGYGYLQFRGAQLGTNASYDAYKLFAVFYPGVLVALCYGASSRDQSWAAGRWLARMLMIVVTALTANAAYRFAQRLEFPPLVVGKDVVEISKAEIMSDVASVNLLTPDMWSRLWANSFLLQKPQYFATHTYEGRLNTPLRGEWDLNGGLIDVKLPEDDSRRINATFSLARTRSPFFVRGRIGEGWYDLERQPRDRERWQWTRGDATVVLENRQTRSLNVRLHFLKVRALVDRDLQVWAAGKCLLTARVGEAGTTVNVPELRLAPGVTTLELRTSTPLTTPASGDSRKLGFRIFGVEVEVVLDETGRS